MRTLLPLLWCFSCGILLVMLLPSSSRGTVPHVQYGVASWYGSTFHGQPTAVEVYDMFQLTAAHGSVPFGTVATVTNLDTGHIVHGASMTEDPLSESAYWICPMRRRIV